MRWMLYFARNAMFGLVPFPETFRSLRRRIRPYPTTISGWTLEQGIRQVEMLRRAGCELRGARVLEVGTGWQPTIPLLFALAGAGEVVLVDMQRLMDAQTFAGTVHSLRAQSGLLSERLQIPVEEIEARLVLDPRHTTLDAMCRQFGFDYRAPFNLCDQALGEKSMDVVCSRTVLEHVPPHVLRSLLSASHGLLKPGGYACHTIDNSDHWAHRDSSLSRVNFLRFSDRTFDWLCRFNPLDYMNRLRHRDYLRMLEETGYEIEWHEVEVCPQALATLPHLPLSERFRGIEPEELAALDSYVLARRPAAVPQATHTAATKEAISPSTRPHAFATCAGSTA